MILLFAAILPQTKPLSSSLSVASSLPFCPQPAATNEGLGQLPGMTHGAPPIMYLSVYLSICLSSIIYLSSIYLIYLPTNHLLSVYLSLIFLSSVIYFSISISVLLCLYLSLYLFPSFSSPLSATLALASLEPCQAPGTEVRNAVVLIKTVPSSASTRPQPMLVGGAGRGLNIRKGILLF